MPSSAYVHQMTPFIGATLFALACVGVDFAVRWRGKDSRGSALKEASANLPLVYIPVIGALTVEGHSDTLYLVCGNVSVIIEIVLFIFLQGGPREVAKPLHFEKPQQTDPRAPGAMRHDTDDHGPSSQLRPTLLAGLHIVAAFCFGIFWIWQPNHPPEQRADSVRVAPSEPLPVPSTLNPPVVASNENRVAPRAPKASIVIHDTGKFRQTVIVTYEDVPLKKKHLWLVVKGTDAPVWTYGTCGGAGGSLIDLARYRETDSWNDPELPIGDPADEADFTLFVLLVDDLHDRTLAKEYKTKSFNCVGTPWEGREDVLKDGTVLTSKVVHRQKDLPKQ